MNKPSRRELGIFGGFGLRSKFIVIIVTMILTIVSVLTIYFISIERMLLNDELRKRATSLAKNFAYVSSYPVFLEDIPAIKKMSLGIMNEEDVVFVCICKMGGEILFELAKEPVAREYHDLLKAHSGQVDSGLRLIERKNLVLVSIPVFKPSDEELAAVAYSGEQTGTRHIAEALIGFSLDGTRKHVVESIQSTLLITIAIAAVGIALALLIVQYLMKPLFSLMVATREIASGNLSYKVETSGDDELGMLAVLFNEMAARLEDNRRVLDEYSWNLERKVRERTEELTKREEELASILENSPTGIILVDANTSRIGWTNSNALRMLKGSKEEIEGQVYRSRFYCNSSSEFGTRDCGMDPDTSEQRLTAADGSEIPVLSSVCRIRYKGLDHLLYTFFDITKYKKLEAQLMQAQKMGAVGTLAGGIAHDFNNLLQSISGYSQLVLMRGNINETDKSSLYQVEQSVRRGAELVKQLLTFSRKVESNLMPLDLNAELEKIVQLLERTIPKMIRIELSLSEALVRVNADPVHLEQLVVNLALNARDAMPEGGRITFSTRTVELAEDYCKENPSLRPGWHVLLSVSDSGTGMEKEMIEHIFEPFYTTKDIGKGTGLGLAMVYGIVKSHRGHIECSSSPNRGSTFNVYFPALKEEGVVQGGTELQSREVVGGQEAILLVDDDELILDIGRDVLEHSGYRVITAESGEEALEIYKRGEERIDLVILDLGMPGMGGKRCLEELLGLDPMAKVIIASGYTGPQKVEETMKSGAAGFIGKPYRLNDMLGSVRKALDRT